MVERARVLDRELFARVEESGELLFGVEDDGAGIADEDQARVFERFFRTDLATSRAVQGTGLGLAICKAIVDSHNGTISIESQPSRGTTFRVRLPLRSAQDGDPPVPAAPGLSRR